MDTIGTGSRVIIIELHVLISEVGLYHAKATLELQLESVPIIFAQGNVYFLITLQL